MQVMEGKLEKGKIEVLPWRWKNRVVLFETAYSRMDQVTFVEDSL